WKQYVDEGERLRVSGRFDLSEAAYQNALALANSPSMLPDYRVIAENNLGVLQQHNGRYLESERSFLSAMRLLDSEPGIARRVRIRVIANLASFYLDTLQNTRAEHLVMRFLPLTKELPELPDGPVLLSDLGTVRIRQGRLEEAETIFKEVISQT